ncbi:MAG: type II secretion system F family protein [Erysipelotrichaceae bacterium]|nr:type II secretion system F family protein [Erysipelotrichaceae bacterium]
MAMEIMGAKDCVLLLEQMSMLLQAGIPLVEGMDSLENNYRNTPWERQIREMVRTMKETGKVSETVARCQWLPTYLREMMVIAERTGNYEQILQSLKEFYLQEASNREAVSHAVRYPTMLLGLMGVIVAALIWYILPIFSQVYQSLGSSIGQQSLALGKTLGGIVLAVVTTVFLVGFSCAVAIKKRKRTSLTQWIKNIPVIRQYRQALLSSRLAYVLGMMMESGYHLEDALDLSSGIVDEEMAKKLHSVSQSMKEGKSMISSMQKEQLFDPFHLQILQMGNETGKIETVLRNFAKSYGTEANQRLHRLLEILEPSLIGTLSVCVGMVLLVVMMPLVGILASLG